MFERIVELYRSSGRPAIEGAAFSYEGPKTAAIDSALGHCQGLPAAYGSFEDGPEYSDGEVSFVWRLAANEFARFYRNINDFIEGSEKLSSGQVPENYYLVAEDIVGGVDEAPPALEMALAINRLIGGLTKLSLGSASSASGSRKLLFVLPASTDVGPKTIEIDTLITPACLHADKPDIALLEELTSQADGRLHINEHRQLFRVSIANVLARRRVDSTESAFQFLVFAWGEVLTTYQLNADCYVQKFSFEKLRAEVARIELDYATRMAAVLGDGSGKILALPLSLGGLAAVWATEDVFTAAGVILGLVLVSLLLSGLLHNQKLAAQRVEAGFKLAIGDVAEGRGRHPDALNRAISEAREGFSNQLSFLKRVHRIVHPVAWLSPIGATLLLVHKFGMGSLYLIVPILLACIAAFAYAQQREQI